ncbi:MAG TPA: site-specific integrase [Nocardioides sp.]|uniref:site-specific integrase n=1 Tax=Nocardioides sp. TaxID=35761 RepID=UPI002E373C05|nr:site-specific integrase [Nocardioides sp.]HEX5088116.1 site-specific integrase [Nocardioides sp.]
MPRPPMPPGAWGQITVTRAGSGTLEASARYVYFSGRVARIRARGPSIQSARTALVRKLQALNGAEAAEGDLTPVTTVAELAVFWLQEKEAQRVSPNSLKAYRGTVMNQVVPVIGERRLRDCRTSVLDRVIKDRAASGFSPTMLRKVLHAMFDVAVRHDVMASNPVRAVARISRPRREIEYLDMAQIQDVRRLIDASSGRARPGPRPTNDLKDAVDLILGTGCRIGETGALIYAEIDLGAANPTLTVSGTIITETGVGTFRQPWTKSSAGYRTLYVPPFAVEILLRRQVDNHANPHGAVFPTRRGTWRQVSNWERMWNRVVDHTDYDWVTFHTFRRSVATLIDREVGLEAAQAQLGHEDSDITRDYYVHKASVAPDLTAQLEKFRPAN